MMVNHIWGLLTHPHREFEQIKKEDESISHLYIHHVFLMAAIPVISAFIGTTQVGWNFGNHQVIKLDLLNAFYLAVVFYALILAAIALMGRVIYWMSRRYESQPTWQKCILFAGYTATPMFLSGLVALYPIVWLCLFFGIIGLCAAGYLMYLGIPTFLNINRKEGFIFSSSTLAIGVLVLEFLLGLTVLLWGYGSRLL